MGSSEILNLKMDVIFTCVSLIYLQLLFCLSTEFDPLDVAIEPNSVNLPCLKTLNLNLDGVTMGDDSFKKLLLGCPVLEELVLESSYFSIIEICSNTLKNLVLDTFNFIDRLKISTPNLLYFDMCGCMRYSLLLLDMPLLVHASIYIDWDDEDTYITMRPKLIHSLSNVERLQLDFSYLDGKVLKKEFFNCPVFNNLNRLKLSDLHLDDLDLALFFLLHSPKLQELTLAQSRLCSMRYLDEEITQEEPEYALVQREFLKKVRIVRFKNDNGFVDRLINKLLVHVKIIGEIDIV